MRRPSYLYIVIAVLNLALMPGVAGRAAAYSEEVERHIAGVESGLCAQYVVDGYEEYQTTYDIYERMKHYNVKGLSIAVMNEGRIEWAKGYGEAEAGTGRMVDTETLFQVASIGKPVTAAGILRLVEAGTFDLDTNINAYLSSWKLAENEFTEKTGVTLELLLSHTGGVTVHGFPGYERGSGLPALHEILDGEPPCNTAPIRVDMIPGTGWRYSGGGFVIVQQGLEDVLGAPFADSMHRLVFEPSGMTRTFYHAQLPEDLEANAAFAYLADGSPVEGGYHLYPEYGAGAGLWSTPSDLAHFAIQIQDSYAGGAGSLLEEQTARDMLTLRNGPYGLGFLVASKSGEVVFSHSGGNAGYRNQLIAYARTGKGAVIMTNSDAGRDIYNEIVRAIAVVYDWPDYGPMTKVAARLSPEQLSAMAGQYEFPGIGPVPLWVEDGHLYAPDLQREGSAVLLLPESPTEFFSPAEGWTLHFELNEAGEITAVNVLVGGMEMTAARIR